MARLWHAAGYSLAGLRAAWVSEAAFRQEVVAAALLLPAAFWLGDGWTEVALLAGSLLLVLIVELLNSAVEAAVDRAGSAWNPARQARQGHGVGGRSARAGAGRDDVVRGVVAAVFLMPGAQRDYRFPMRVRAMISARRWQCVRRPG